MLDPKTGVLDILVRLAPPLSLADEEVREMEAYTTCCCSVGGDAESWVVSVAVEACNPHARAPRTAK